MIILQGKSVFGGIASGRLSFLSKRENAVEKHQIQEVEKEIYRFEKAKATAIKELESLYEKAMERVGQESASIFQIHKMMLEDLDFIEAVVIMIKEEKVNAEYAIYRTGETFANMFSSMEDEYMKERGADVQDISNRVLNVLIHGEGENLSVQEPVIIAAEDLVPSETIQLDKSKVLGFITAKGSSNSHTAILARTMNIPAIINLGEELLKEYDGKEAILDGFSGKVYIEPDSSIITYMEEKKAADEERRKLLNKMKGKETITIDNQRVNLYANIGNISDVEAVLENDAEGIGLFRSEFLYLENKDYPTEEQQFKIYKEVAEKMQGKKVIIRTLDIGADKQAEYFNLPQEENPAMGYRAIRICLDEKELFKTQLRALYRAAAYGNISIMFPMIISLEEVIQIKEVIKEVKEELINKEVNFKEKVEIGIMIETPAAVIISDLLAKEVDFFSIGTNDLTQYTLAIDRQNPKLDKVYDSHHKAVLRMLKMVADNAHKAGIWVGICGELAADLELTKTFLSMGFNELSVSPAFILGLREKIRGINVSKEKDNVLYSIITK